MYEIKVELVVGVGPVFNNCQPQVFSAAAPHCPASITRGGGGFKSREKKRPNGHVTLTGSPGGGASGVGGD